MSNIRTHITSLKALAPVQLLTRILRGLSDKNVTLVAGGVAFYAFLSLFPTIACILTIWGMVATVGDVSGALLWLEGIAPRPVYEVISGQLTYITEREGPASFWAALMTFLFAVWSASYAVTALFSAMEVMYDARHNRRYVLRKSLALLFTLAGISFVVFSIFLIGAVPPVLEALHLGEWAGASILTLRWLLILGFFFIGGCAFYAASRKNPKETARTERNQILPGAIAASLIWLLASLAFSFYLARFSYYNETFGSLGAVAALLIWLWVSAFALLLGAQINADAGENDKSSS